MVWEKVFTIDIFWGVRSVYGLETINQREKLTVPCVGLSKLSKHDCGSVYFWVYRGTLFWPSEARPDGAEDDVEPQTDRKKVLILTFTGNQTRENSCLIPRHIGYSSIPMFVAQIHPASRWNSLFLFRFEPQLSYNFIIKIICLRSSDNLQQRLPKKSTKTAANWTSFAFFMGYHIKKSVPCLFIPHPKWFSSSSLQVVEVGLYSPCITGVLIITIILGITV